MVFDEIEKANDITFDTLVADCEGALYYIIQDEPNMFDNINTIIMENDYHDINQKEFLDNFLLNKSFKRIYVNGGGWGPCAKYFFEVWKKLV